MPIQNLHNILPFAQRSFEQAQKGDFAFERSQPIELQAREAAASGRWEAARAALRRALDISRHFPDRQVRLADPTRPDPTWPDPVLSSCARLGLPLRTTDRMPGLGR